MTRSLLLGVFMASSVIAFADTPCVPGTLADYLSLPDAGCAIGGLTFQAFALGPIAGFATEIDPAAVMLTPASFANISSLLITLNVTAGPGEVLESVFGFHIPAPAASADITLGNPEVTGDGAITGVLDVCTNTDFFFPGSCFGDEEKFGVAFATSFDQMLSDSVPLSGASFFDVFVDVTVDGGLNGTAALDTARVSIVTPEPGSAILLITAASLLFHLQLRRGRR